MSASGALSMGSGVGSSGTPTSAANYSFKVSSPALGRATVFSPASKREDADTTAAMLARMMGSKGGLPPSLGGPGARRTPQRSASPSPTRAARPAAAK
ncbi:hypothetical protein EON68_04260 [archaeon]|nr:MAG: hypothetical protein EON68_04260 [archaeon]